MPAAAVLQAVASALAEPLAQKEQALRESDLEHALGPDEVPTQEEREKMQQMYSTSLHEWTCIFAAVLKQVADIVPSWCTAVRDHATAGVSQRSMHDVCSCNAGLDVRCCALSCQHHPPEAAC
jgi:hypothetical protein